MFIDGWFEKMRMSEDRNRKVYAGTNFSLQDEPWAEFTTLEVAACKPGTYCPV
jgi:hypothetical protein